MAALARLGSSSCSTPVLDLFTSVSGVLTDVSSVQYQIFDNSSGSPVQVFPTQTGQRAAVNLTACPTGDYLGTGHYVARWDVPENENLGSHLVTWFFKLTPTSAEQTYTEEFEVLAEVIGAGDGPASYYCMVQDLRDEGFADTTRWSDAWIQQRINIASRYIEATTRRFFYPRQMTLKMDGHGGPKLLFSDPIISIDSVMFEISPLYPDEFTVVEADIMRVYNRHLTQNLTEPDDRNSPKIELFNPGFVRERQRSMLTQLNFPFGQQNIQVSGLFGYTDWDGSATGKTPDLIRHACKLLVVKELGRMSRSAERGEARNRYRVVSEGTRDQNYSLEALGARVGAFFSGDPEIDNILAYFQRPPAMGAA